ncbi:MAG TPA: L,D-transpeptidase [bacterium]|nr:L,D-transpeptidase [bacterium]
MKYYLSLITVIVMLSLLSGSEILAGEKTKIVINIPNTTLYLYRGEKLIKEYRITVGHIDTPTPIGNFKVINKTINPTWYPTDGSKPIPPGPNNKLGTRWIGIDKPHYGIHGTIKPREIGKATSDGCVRIKNEDIEELYPLVPLKTLVEIRYQTIDVKRENKLLKITIYSDIYALGTNTIKRLRKETGLEMDDSFWKDAIKKAEEKGLYRFTIFSGGEEE